MAITETKIEERIITKLKENPDQARGIGAAVAFELTGEGGARWLIDCSKDPAIVRKETGGAAATTISMDVETFEKIAKGELNPQMAFLSGKVKVDGNLGLAIKLGQLLT